jgi:predicted glutamine amidotransferase
MGGTHEEVGNVSVAGVLGLTGEPGGPVVQAEQLAGDAEPALPARGGATNGDGFGVGWYGAHETPGVFRSTEPAWNDRNLHLFFLALT